MKICVLGAGALGSTFGGTLAEAGNEVFLINRNKDYLKSVREKGLIFVEEEIEPINVKVYPTTDNLDTVDLVIVLVKSFNTKEVIESAKNIIGENTIVMSLQNGLGNEDTIAELVGKGKVISGKTYVGGGMIQPGHVRRTVKNKMTYIGELDGTKTERIERIAKIFTEAGLQTEVSKNIIGLIWDKLLINAATGALTAITRLTYGPIYKDEAIPEIKEIGLKVIQEGIDVASAKNIKLSTKNVEEIWYKAAENLPYEFKTSMLQSIEKGSVTEIDFINGAIVREGKKVGISTPVNEALVACIKGIEYNIINK
jgi:2-dehydropantoate 2-reductase